MTLVPVKLPPGLYHNGTRYDASGRWYDGNGVRWVEGTIRPIGGWKAFTDSNDDQVVVSGKARAILSWQSNDGKARLAIGTHTHLYVFCEGVLSDITPNDLITGQANTTFSSGGWNIGGWNIGGWGIGDARQSTRTEASVWQLDTFGEDLVGCLASDGRLWYWDRSSGGDATAFVAEAPLNNCGIVVTPERFIVALGANGEGRHLMWASQETADVWFPEDTNTAGDFYLEGRGDLMCGRRGRNETLLWTNEGLWVMRYIGGTLVYSVTLIGSECGIVSRNAVSVVAGAQAYWMGRRGFYTYDGFVRPVPCEVSDYVFGDFNTEQREKVFATTRSDYGEVTWFYPSKAGNEIDRYVTLNYREGHWYYGQLVRTIDTNHTPFENPIAVDANGYVWEHEVGSTRTGMTPYLESGPYELASGEYVQQIRKVLPDEKTLGDVSATFYASLYPTSGETFQTVSLANPTDVRLTGRQVRIRLIENESTDWRVGTMRVDTVPAGRR